MTEPIRFNHPSIEGREMEYIREAVDHGHTSSSGPFSARVVFYGMGYEAPYNRWACEGYTSVGGPVTGDVQAFLSTLPGGTATMQMVLTLRFESGDTLEIVTFGGEPVPVTGEEKARISFDVVGGTGLFEGAEGSGQASVYDAELPPADRMHPSQAGLRLELHGDIRNP